MNHFSSTKISKVWCFVNPFTPAALPKSGAREFTLTSKDPKSPQPLMTSKRLWSQWWICNLVLDNRQKSVLKQEAFSTFSKNLKLEILNGSGETKLSLASCTAVSIYSLLQTLQINFTQNGMVRNVNKPYHIVIFFVCDNISVHASFSNNRKRYLLKNGYKSLLFLERIQIGQLGHKFNHYYGR